MSLKEHIRTKVLDAGPMPFEEFMALALYHPDGFFGGERLRSEKAGDFLTSPEVSPLFGQTLASYVSAEHRRIGDPFAFYEVGSGSGSLLRPLLEEYEIGAHAIEASPAARRSLEATLPSDRIHDSLQEVPRPLRGVVLANELIDNLPMAVAQRVDGRWRERWVGVAGDDLVFVDSEPRPEVAEWLAAYGGDVTDGGWVEVQLHAGDWLVEAIEGLEAGSVVLIDYGDTAEGLLPRRADGTLRTYRAHHLGPHPLADPGKTDITADVNFTALQAVANRAGASTRLVRQDDFLTELGLRDRLTELRYQELEATRAERDREGLALRSIRTGVETLLHPRGLGDFRVLLVTV
ncbi:MAG: class I SAM-dependent methyltransferase [Acidimicrobiia bacterium]